MQPYLACLQVCNFPAIDALIQPSYLFQMTIMQKKEVHGAGLERAQKRLRSNPKRLYFVVPAPLFEGYKMVTGLRDQVEQWVLKIDGV